VAGAERVSPAVDVAVVAYRRWDLTRSCLQHLGRQTIPHRVTLCDNGCDENTADRVAAEYPEVHVLRLETNMPYAIACNRAIAAGDADFVVMMNNDVDARPDFIERLVAPFATDPAVGSVSSLLLRPGEEVIDSAGLVADVTLAGFARFQGLPCRQARSAQPALTGPAGAAAAFRRSAWEQVGGLDEAIHAYLEDLDLALRLRQAGWSAAIALEAVGVHVGSATFGHRSAGQRWRAGFARGYLLRRYGVLRTSAAVRTIATEALVVAGDLALSQDASALRGRLAGWRAAAGRPPRAFPPPPAIDHRIGMLESFRLRRNAYSGGA
jgi:N-acetylglucosaminyl-diphospho-decaprenol L-rhamnosyltransferase